MADKRVLQPHCPACKATGAMVLVLAITFRWRDIGSPVLECTKCHAMFAIDQFICEVHSFFTQIPLVGQ